MYTKSKKMYLALSATKKSPVVSVDPLVYPWFHFFFFFLLFYFLPGTKTMLATKGKESPGLQIINHKPNCFHTGKETRVQGKRKKKIHKWANHREVKLPISKRRMPHFRGAKLQLILSSGNWDDTWEDTISRVKHNVLSHGSLSLWFLRGWSQKYSKFKSDPITGIFFCRANTSYSCTGKQTILKTTAVKLTLHKWRPSYPDVRMDTLTGRLSSNALSSVQDFKQSGSS